MTPAVLVVQAEAVVLVGAAEEVLNRVERRDRLGLWG
jgi:hypothetical protein